MRRTPPTIHYSRLRYERTSPYSKGRVPRIWIQESVYKSFFKDLLKDIWKLLKWFKRLYRKELVVGIVLLLALLPEPHQVKAAPLIQDKPAYIKPVPHLQPAVAITAPVPEELAPAPEPQPIAPPVVAPPVVSSGCVTGFTVANYYENLLIQRESSGNSCANNGSCVGLLQACPSSKLYAVCPSLEVSCQLNFFEGYMLSTYGSWANAWARDEARYPHWW